jgi:hypothetical protein
MILRLVLLRGFPLVFIRDTHNEEDEAEYQQGVDHLRSYANSESSSKENDSSIKQ